MDINIENIDNDKNETILNVLKNENEQNVKSDKEILFITTDCWLAQLGSRKKN